MKLHKKSMVYLIMGVFVLPVTACSPSKPNGFEKVSETIHIDEEVRASVIKRHFESKENYEGMETRGPVSFNFDTGKWLNNTTYKYADFFIIMPEGWERASEKEVEELRQKFDTPNIKFKMLIMNPETIDSIFFIIQDLGTLSTELESTVDEVAFLESIQPELGIDEGEKLDSEIREVLLGGKTYKYLSEITDSDDTQCVQYYAARRIGNEMMLMLITGSLDGSIDQFAAIFSNMR